MTPRRRIAAHTALKGLQFVVGITAVSVLGCASARTDPPADLALRNVDVFDSRSGSVLENRTIVIRDGVIDDVIDGEANVVANDTIEGNGRLVTPGFIDTHAHLGNTYATERFTPEHLLQQDREVLSRTYLAHGTTIIADMGQRESWLDTMLVWEATSDPAFPDLAVVGGSLNSDLEWDTNPPLHHTKLATPEIARAKVQEYAELGVRRLKLYWKLLPPEMSAIIDEAAARGMLTYAHVDNGFVSIPEAMDLGVRNFEHFFTLYRSIVDPDDVRDALARRLTLRPAQNLDEWTGYLSVYFDYIRETPHHHQALVALLERMANEEASISTTLNVLAASTGRTPTFSAFDPYPLRYRPLFQDDFLAPETLSAAFSSVVEYVKLAHEIGVTLRIGTDTRNGGEALLAELVLLAEAGIDMADVLKIATINGAEALGIADRYGHIEAGMSADLIMFDHSPLEDAEHVREGKTVIKGGHVFIPLPSIATTAGNVFSEEGVEAGIVWIQQNRGAAGMSPVHTIEVADAAQRLLYEGKGAEAEALLGLIDGGDSPAGTSAYFDEAEINRAGYSRLAEGDIEEAITVLAFNVARFPESWNVYDSLGEAYMNNGEIELAIQNYETSLSLNPENASGRDMLKKLKGN